MLAILGVITSALVLLGIVAAPMLIDVIAYGFKGAKRDLTIYLVRILFPGAGLLVMSAWCLGVLNSHRRFFLSYSVGVVWNFVMLAALLWFGPRAPELRLVAIFAASSVVASAVVFAVQLPVVLKLVPHLRIAFSTQLASVRTVIRNFGPVFVSRGVVQISAFIDSILASPIGGGPSILAYVANISALPVSLFGMSVSASELPEMSSAVGAEAEIAAFVRRRLVNGLRRITFLVIPSVVAFVALGDMIVAPIYQHGKFTAADTLWAWGVLAGSGVGLLASTQGRLYSSTFYALKDTRTPLRFAIVRIALTTVLGYLSVKQLPALLGIDQMGNRGTYRLSGHKWLDRVSFTAPRTSEENRFGTGRIGLSGAPLDRRYPGRRDRLRDQTEDPVREPARCRRALYAGTVRADLPDAG